MVTLGAVQLLAFHWACWRVSALFPQNWDLQWTRSPNTAGENHTHTHTHTHTNQEFSKLVQQTLKIIRKLITLFDGGDGGLVAKSCLTLATPWTVALQAPVSMGFSRQEYWSGLPFPPPGDLPDPEIKPQSTALQGESLPTELPGQPILFDKWIWIQLYGWRYTLITDYLGSQNVCGEKMTWCQPP